MRIAYPLTTAGGIISVTTSCWVKNLHLSFVAHMNLKLQSDLLKWTGRTKIWQKNTCAIAAFLERLRATITFQRFPCILRKWQNL